MRKKTVGIVAFILAVGVISAVLVTKGGSEKIQNTEKASGVNSIDEMIESLKPGQAYALVDIDQVNAALLVTDGVFDNGDGNMAAIDATIYGYDMKENFMEYGKVMSDGTAYPLATKDGYLYFGGGHHMGKEYIDSEKASIMTKEDATEVFDEKANATYYYFSLDEQFEGTVDDDSKLKALFEEYASAQVVYFTVKE